MDTRTAPSTNLVPLGIPGLDDVLGGGIPADRVYLVEGDPGAGKTTLALQFLLDGRGRGERGLYVTLSETTEELRAVAHSHGWNLDGIHLTELATAEASLSADAENTMFYPSEVELSQVTERVLRDVESLRPARVVFDSLSELRMMAQNPLRYRRQILALKQFFVGRHCTVLLLDDRSAGDNDIQVQSIVHGVIGLELRTPDYGIMQRRLQILKLRGRAYRPGYHDFVIVTGGLRVFPRLVAAEHTTPYAPSLVPSGVPELDALMGGGLDRGTSTLIVGPAGSGKSTFATQYAVHVAQKGERAAMFLFDESPRTLCERAKGLGMPVATLLDQALVGMRQVDPGELSVGELVQLVRDEVEKHASRLIVIDSLNGYLNAIPDERFLTLQLHELLSYLSQRGVTSILVMAQSGMVGQMIAPVDASYLADSVILLRYFEAFGEVRQAISVLKRRGGRHERTVREFRFGNRGIRIGDPLSEFQGVLTGVPTYTGDEGPLLGRKVQ
ncbi:MAG TPA: ATPase domain-containing protein [Casimicrobiaceae bacterium]|nr:ATPase domain-containing protein [Casimicrobiaceae bacterium]